MTVPGRWFVALCLFQCAAAGLDFVRSLDSLDPMLVPWAISSLEYISQNEPKKRFRRGVELFVEEASIIISAGKYHHLQAVAYDDKYHDDCFNNIIKRKGFSRALNLIMEVLPGGNVWAAPVCGPWVFICRKGTGRTKKDAAGDLKKPQSTEGECDGGACHHIVAHCMA